MIPVRPLGRIGLETSALGFGVSGPLGSPLTGEGQVRALIEQAHAGGVRLFDTAPFYGDAEPRLGRALRGVPRGEIVVVSKAGTRFEAGRAIKDFTPAGVRASLERSLQSLRLDRLDVLLLHGPPSAVGPELLDTLRALLAQGLVRAVGVCGRGEELRLAVSDPVFSVIQAPVHSPWPGWAQAQGLGFLGIEALFGLRRGFGLGAGDAWRLLRRLRPAAPAAEPAGEADAEALLRRALETDGVSAVVTTTTQPRRLAENLRIAARLCP